MVDGIPLRKGYRVRAKFTGARHALYGMVVEARVGAAVGDGRYDGSPWWSAVIYPASQITAVEKDYMQDSAGNTTITGAITQPKNGIRSSPCSLFLAIEQHVAEALGVSAPTGLHRSATLWLCFQHDVVKELLCGAGVDTPVVKRQKICCKDRSARCVWFPSSLSCHCIVMI